MVEDKESKKDIIDDFGEEDEIVSDSDFHNFDRKPEVFGVLDRFEDTSFGLSPVFKTNEGEVWIGTHTALKDKLTTEDIGVKIKLIAHWTTSKKSGRDYRNFRIFKRALGDSTPAL